MEQHSIVFVFVTRRFPSSYLKTNSEIPVSSDSARLAGLLEQPVSVKDRVWGATAFVHPAHTIRVKKMKKRYLCMVITKFVSVPFNFGAAE